MNIALTVFARAPRAGVTKTRLIPALGAQGAADLYEGLLTHALALARAAPVTTRCLRAADAEARAALSLRADVHGFELAVQSPGSLGARMHAACADALRAHDAVLLMGSDLVDNSVGDLALAARWLEHDADVVLGPVADGGYWLIGLRAARVDLFDGMPWGSGSVYARTVAVLAATHTPWRALPLRHDIDVPADLIAHAAALPPLGRRVL